MPKWLKNMLMWEILNSSGPGRKSKKVNHQKKHDKIEMEVIETSNTAEDALMDADGVSEEISQEVKILNFKTTLSDLREPQLSSTLYVNDLSWQIKLQESSTANTKALGFYLKCNGVLQPSTWSCFAAAELRLLKHWNKPNVYSEGGDDAFGRKISHVYNADVNEAGFPAFISWQDLCDPRRGFLVDNTIEAQVYVKADIPRIECATKPSINIQEETDSDVTYYFELSNMSTFRGKYKSGTFDIHNMPFRLMLQTVPKEEPLKLAAFLICLGDLRHPSWNCYVEAELRLMNQNSFGAARTYTLKHSFCKDDPRCGSRKFIRWKYLLDSRKGFLKNDTAHFEIEVKRNASYVGEIQIDMPMACRARNEVKIKCAACNISQLKDSLFAAPFYVCGLPWRIKLMHRICIGPTREIHRYLSIYLQCIQESSDAWSCNAIAVLSLLKDGSEECGRILQHRFSKENNCSGFSHFIPWSQVLDPKVGFINNDSITLVVYVRAEEPCGLY